MHIFRSESSRIAVRGYKLIIRSPADAEFRCWGCHLPDRRGVGNIWAASKVTSTPKEIPAIPCAGSHVEDSYDRNAYYYSEDYVHRITL